MQCKENLEKNPCCERLKDFRPPVECDKRDDEHSLSGIVSKPSTAGKSTCEKPVSRGGFCSDSYYSTTTNLTDDQIHYLSPISSLTSVSDAEGIFPVDYRTPTILKLLTELPPATTVSSTISCIEPLLQRTLCIIKPDAMKYKETILRVIKDAGFTIIRERTIHLTPEQVSEIYAKHYGSSAFPNMVITMSVGPVLVICMSAVNAVSKWKNIVGPDKILPAEWFARPSMRVRFGLHDDLMDVIYASETIFDAEKENRYFNPESILEPIKADELQVTDYCNQYINPVLTDGLTELLKNKPADPIVWLAKWLLNNNPYQPRLPEDIAILPT